VKVNPNGLERFLRKPDPAVRLALVHGDDAGLVRELADRIALSVVADPADPFLVADLAAKQLDEDPARLGDEAAAISMIGGRRVVRLRGAADRHAEAVAGALAGAGDALVVAEADALRQGSKLRKLAEESAAALAIACYADSADALDQLIEEVLARHKLAIEPDAQDWLRERLGGDRMVSRGELEKLALYMASSATPRVTLDDAEAAIGDTAAADLDRIVNATLGGDMAALDRALARAFAAGETAVGILRVLTWQVMRLHLARGMMDGGQPADRAMASLRPPVPFPRQASFRAQVAIWTRSQLAEALALLAEAEIECKTTGLPADTMCARALVRLASFARRARRA
jgi:DNA polymerase-3 subunit delta